jgi:hypothetical protein
VTAVAGIARRRADHGSDAKLRPDPRPRDGRLSVHHHPCRAPDRRFFGGTGSFEEAALLVIWLQFILICVQVIQIVTLFVLPPLAGLITIIAIALCLASGELHRRAARVHLAGHGVRGHACCRPSRCSSSSASCCRCWVSASPGLIA